MKKQFLNIKSVSEYLTLGKSTIYKLVAQKEIPFYKVGSRILFDIDEINMWLRNDGSLGENKEISFLDIKPFLD